MPLLLLALAACKGDDPDDDRPEELREISAAPRAKAKSGEMWRADLMQGLSLGRDQVCRELGTVDCIADAHLVSMGGMDAEKLGVDKPLADPPSSAPMAFDRVAIHACKTRLELDQQGGGVIFGPVLAANTPEAREEVAETLIRKLLGREGTAEQRAGLSGLFDTLEPLATDPVVDWSVGACLVVATSTEALFY